MVALFRDIDLAGRAREAFGGMKFKKMGGAGLRGVYSGRGVATGARISSEARRTSEMGRHLPAIIPHATPARIPRINVPARSANPNWRWAGGNARNMSAGTAAARASRRSSGFRNTARNVSIAGGVLVGGGAYMQSRSRNRASGARSSLYGPPGRTGQYY